MEQSGSHDEQCPTADASSASLVLVKAAFDAFARRDVAALTALCTAQVRVESVTATVASDGAAYVGHRGLAYYMADVERAWEVLEIEPTTFVAVGPDVVVVEGHVRAWGSGRVIAASTSWLWRLRGGLVDAVRIFDTGDGARAAAAQR